MNNKKWTFDQAPNTAVFTTRQIIEKTKPILYVSHDIDDHGWQFLTSEEILIEDTRIISLEEAIEIDPTILEISKIQPGYYAVRKSKEDNWEVKI
jgi:hypothetical protein